MIAAQTVTATASEILAPPGTGTVLPAYQFVALCNTGSETAYLKFTADATAVSVTNGIALPAGASILVDQDDSPILANGISAICATGKTTTVAVQAY